MVPNNPGALDSLAAGGAKPHHSTDDWDFLKASDWSDWLQWGLTNYVFVSPPTSLYIDSSNAGGDKYALSNLVPAQDLKTGRLVTYHRRALSGVARTLAYIGVTGAGSTGIRVELASPTTEWLHTRITWWQGFSAPGIPATIIERATQVNGLWVPDPWMYQPPMAGDVNRVGIGCTVQSLGRNHYFDDTEILAPCV